jgi:glycosyltransferase involved in cell wall biosynthesis
MLPMRHIRIFPLLVFFITYFCQFIPLYSNPDLTIVGYIMPEDGLGKIPITILKTLQKDISVNIRFTRHKSIDGNILPPCVMNAVYNPDQSPGKVALFTDALWYLGNDHYAKIPGESTVKIAYSMLETTRIPSMWVKILNENFDAVVVPDQFYVKVYEKSGVQIPIFVLPIPMILDPYYAHPPHMKSPSNPFVFGDASANKNPSVLIESFAKAFGNDPSVRLFLRALHIRRENYAIINNLINQYELTNVIVETGSISLGQFIDRLASFDCYINLSKGEGFSFIPREALALGLPVITTNNTALKTVCKSGFVRAVQSYLKVPPLPAYKQLFGDENIGKQFDCEVDDVVAALRDVYENYDEYIIKAQEGREWVKQYNSTSTGLQELYRTLIKPKEVILGSSNEIRKGVIITDSPHLLEKYQRIMQ